MKIVGLTGGIGSGKSFVARVFNQLGIPVYDADSHAKNLMLHDAHIKNSLIAKFGSHIYFNDGTLDRKQLSDIIFNSDEARIFVNTLVHPVVGTHFELWIQQYQAAPYVIKESAILFESGADKGVTFPLCVTAPFQLRVERVKKRDFLTEEKVLTIMKSQMDDGERSKRCHYSIVNDNETALLPQVLALDKLFRQ